MQSVIWINFTFVKNVIFSKYLPNFEQTYQKMYLYDFSFANNATNKLNLCDNYNALESILKFYSQK